jgi:hypothetical protein
MAVPETSSPPHRPQHRVQSNTSLSSQYSHHSSHRRNSASSTRRPVRPAFKREKSGTTSKKRVSIEDPESQAFEDHEDMTTSFPQFCTSCERQIITPNSTILYCSESCRRRDMNKPLASSVPSPHHLRSRPMTPAESLSGLEHLSPPRDIIPQKSPTITANRFSFTDLFTAGQASDPEEDVEVSEESQAQATRPNHHRRQDSEAAKYLRQFQSPSFIVDSTTKPLRRPNPQSRSSTYSLAPSLTHSPSPGTSPSSYTPLSSLPLAYSRPLPPRANPYSRSYGTKGMSLVTPHAGARSVPHVNLSNLPGLKAQPSLSTNVGADELPNELPVEDLTYEKKSMVSSAPREGKSAIRSLFRFDDMQAPPSH